ncbi:L-arabinose isomerase, partial [Salmonella enterica subsp. enterica serovar Heidelberg str. SARA36]
DTRQLKVCRFGDNMREVAVTDGDKVAAQIKFGFSATFAGYRQGWTSVFAKRSAGSLC